MAATGSGIGALVRNGDMSFALGSGTLRAGDRVTIFVGPGARPSSRARSEASSCW